MVRTPWGDAEDLRARKLSPGLRIPPEEVAQNQRERLFGAMVATVAEKGYEATTVSDLLTLSGVSRASFYRLFDDKKGCFLATVEALIEPTVSLIDANPKPAGRARAREVFEAFISMIARNAAASRVCFLEIFSAGPEAVMVLEKATNAFEALAEQALEQMPERSGLSPQLRRLIIAGLHRIIHMRLRRGEEQQLVDLVPQMWDWALSYPPPPEPLRKPRRSAAGAAGGGLGGYDEPERILRAFAATVVERGYGETTLHEVAERASCSLSTFYSHFPGKEEAMLAAIDSAGSQMMGAVMPAYRRAPDWPQAIRSALRAMFAYGVAEPVYMELGTAHAFAAGRRVQEQRDDFVTALEELFRPGFELAPRTPAVASQGIAGAIYALMFEQVRSKGAPHLPEIVPQATYVALTPFIGAAEACRVANGERRRGAAQRSGDRPQVRD